MEYDERIERTVRLLDRSGHLVVFTGAGIGTESGPADYRGPDGVGTRRKRRRPGPHPFP